MSFSAQRVPGRTAPPRAMRLTGRRYVFLGTAGRAEGFFTPRRGGRRRRARGRAQRRSAAGEQGVAGGTALSLRAAGRGRGGGAAGEQGVAGGAAGERTAQERGGGAGRGGRRGALFGRTLPPSMGKPGRPRRRVHGPAGAPAPPRQPPPLWAKNGVCRIMQFFARHVHRRGRVMHSGNGPKSKGLWITWWTMWINPPPGCGKTGCIPVPRVCISPPPLPFFPERKVGGQSRKRATFLSRKKSSQKKVANGHRIKAFSSPASSVAGFLFSSFSFRRKKRKRKESPERTCNKGIFQPRSLCGGVSFFLPFLSGERKGSEKKAGNGHKNKDISGKAPSVTLVC